MKRTFYSHINFLLNLGTTAKGKVFPDIDFKPNYG